MIEYILNIEILKEKLLELKIPSQLINNISYLYGQRTIYAKGKDRIISKGLMVVLYLLFYIYTNGLESILTPEVNILQFVDDIYIYTKSDSISLNNNKLNQTMYDFSYWLDKKNLKKKNLKS